MFRVASEIARSTVPLAYAFVADAWWKGERGRGLPSQRAEAPISMPQRFLLIVVAFFFNIAAVSRPRFLAVPDRRHAQLYPCTHDTRPAADMSPTDKQTPRRARTATRIPRRLPPIHHTCVGPREKCPWWTRVWNSSSPLAPPASSGLAHGIGAVRAPSLGPGLTFLGLRCTHRLWHVLQGS